MKYSKILIPFFAVALFAACSGKDSSRTNENVPSVQQEEKQAVVADDNVGNVIELTDPATLAPGTKVSRLTVVDFNAVWCPPCRQLSPVLEEMAKKYAGQADFISVDVDKYGELMIAYNLGNSIPVVLFLKPDGTSDYYVGTGDLLPAEKFDNIIKQNLK